jgi:NADH-ubiquinone oxidoreductase chain 5
MGLLASLAGAIFTLIFVIARISTHQWAVTVDWGLAQLGSTRVEVPFLFDVFRCTFMATVLTIASAVIVFSKAYIRGEKHFLRFHLLVVAFVLSMLFLITSPNLISILLGWDGLGVTSYLLVIYFQRTKSFNAGLLTALTNRIGDVLILFSIAAISAIGRWNFFVWAHAPSVWGGHEGCMLLLIVAARTKSAQVPFSAWLPAAMAAPTPVSSLVHSSTLVTAGVYLLFRFSELLAHRAGLPYLLGAGILTIIIAGASALKELDMKKIVALSTLRQLGLIMATLGLGLYEIAYFHLLTHAFFKALLFMAVGNIIHLSRDFQDLRKIRLIEFCYPVSLSFSLVANCSLCGLPFLAGFYSKDLILELMLRSSENYLISLLMFTAVGLTVMYTVRFVFLIMCGGLSSAPCLRGADNDWIMGTSITILWPLAVMGGRLLIWAIFSVPVFTTLPQELKNAAIGVILTARGLASLLSLKLGRLSPGPGAWTWGAMWALPFISAIFLNRTLLTLAAIARKLDLAWVVSFSWAPIFSLERMVALDKSTLQSKFFRTLILMAWLTLSIIIFYLRI